MEFSKFLTKQEEVYSRFRDTSKLQTEGTKPTLSERQGGYLIIFRHPPEMAQEIENLSIKVSQVLPSLSYDSSTVHTTISDLIVGEDFIPNRNTLDKLCECVSETNLTNKPLISYSELLYNQNTVLVAGVPNETFFEIIKEVYYLGKQKGVNVRFPWGAHITVSRILEERRPKELANFFKLMEEVSISTNSVPENIDVGYFDFGRMGFKITTYERFKL